MAHSYLSSRGLVAKTPDSHIENWGSNPAGGKKTACIFCLNFETFRRFCDFLRAIESSRPTESEKIKVKNIRTQFFSEWICIFTLKFFSFLYSKFKQNYYKMVEYWHFFKHLWSKMHSKLSKSNQIDINMSKIIKSIRHFELLHAYFPLCSLELCAAIFNGQNL